MISDKSTLFAFIAENRVVRDGDIGADLALLEPYFRKAETGMYDLAPSAALRPEETAATLTAATGAKIANVSFVSLEGGAKPLHGAAAAAFWEAHARDLTGDVKGYLFKRNMAALEAALGRELHDRLGNVLWQEIAKPLWHSFECNRWEETGHTLRLVIRANLLMTLRQFTGFLLLGDEPRLATLRPLMKLMAIAMPIGERRGAAGTWTAIAG